MPRSVRCRTDYAPGARYFALSAKLACSALWLHFDAIPSPDPNRALLRKESSCTYRVAGFGLAP